MILTRLGFVGRRVERYCVRACKAAEALFLVVPSFERVQVLGR